jgi:hypothetical protein
VTIHHFGSTDLFPATAFEKIKYIGKNQRYSAWAACLNFLILGIEFMFLHSIRHLPASVRRRRGMDPPGHDEYSRFT